MVPTVNPASLDLMAKKVPWELPEETVATVTTEREERPEETERTVLMALREPRVTRELRDRRVPLVILVPEARTVPPAETEEAVKKVFQADLVLEV